jgi:hypothetical protein
MNSHPGRSLLYCKKNSVCCFFLCSGLRRTLFLVFNILFALKRIALAAFLIILALKRIASVGFLISFALERIASVGFLISFALKRTASVGFFISFALKRTASAGFLISFALKRTAFVVFLVHFAAFRTLSAANFRWEVWPCHVLHFIHQNILTFFLALWYCVSVSHVGSATFMQVESRKISFLRSSSGGCVHDGVVAWRCVRSETVTM